MDANRCPVCGCAEYEKDTGLSFFECGGFANRGDALDGACCRNSGAVAARLRADNAHLVARIQRESDAAQRRELGVNAGTGPVVAELLADTKWSPEMVCVAGAIGMVAGPGYDLAAAVKRRHAKGIETYGHALRPDTRKPDGTPYDWREEAIDELVDAMLYLRAAMEVERG